MDMVGNAKGKERRFAASTKSFIPAGLRTDSVILQTRCVACLESALFSDFEA